MIATKTSCGRRPLVAKSCSLCFELKTKEHYLLLVTGYFDSSCKKCRYAAPSRKGKTKTNQQEALEGAVKHREPWTDREIQRMLAMRSAGFSAKSVALILNRSVYSVYTMTNKVKDTK